MTGPWQWRMRSLSGPPIASGDSSRRAFLSHRGSMADIPVTADEGVRRRDFLNVAAVSFAGVCVVAAVGPLLVQMAPPADVLALATTEVDISKVQPGQGI